MATSFLSMNTQQYNPYQNFAPQQTSSTSGSQDTTAQPTTQPTSTASSSSSAQDDDTVKLSETAQAKLMHQQGQSVSAIAASLGTTTKQIDQDLSITLDEELQKTLEATTSSAASA